MPLVIISHRGNTSQINSEQENSPNYIDEAIKTGFQVEVDVRFIDKKWYLGHDGADYKVSLDWMKKRSGHIWFHIKNQEGLLALSKIDSVSPLYWKYFWQQNDDYALTSTGHIWTHCAKIARGKNSIATLLKETDEAPKKIYGICTDWPLSYREKGL